MSIDVPTADRSGVPTEPGDRRGPPSQRGGWIVFVVVLLAVAAVIATGAGESEITAAPPTGVPADPITPVDAPPSGRLGDWSLTAFPGSGTFTASAVGPNAVLAAGWDPGGPGDAFAWLHDPRTTTWTPVAVDDADRATITAAAATDGEIWVGGAVSSVGLPSEPALWRLSPDDRSRLVRQDPPLGTPGQVDAVRSLDGTLVVLGRAGVVNDGYLMPGSARFGRLVVRVDGQWVDRTPQGLSVVVTEVISSDGLWTAVGGDTSRAVVWTSDDRGATWSEPDVVASRAVATDVTKSADAATWIAVRTWDDRLEPRVQVFGQDGEVWAPTSEPLRRDVGWIVPVDGGLAGGGIGRPGLDLWFHAPAGDWSRTTLPARGDDGAVMAESWPLVVGAANGQPAVWLDRPITWIPAVDASDPGWERVGAPALGEPSLDVGGILVGLRSAAVTLSVNGLHWIERQLPGRLVGVAPGDGSVLAWGVDPNGAYIEDIDIRGVLSSGRIPDAAIRTAWREGTSIVVLAETGSGSVRLQLGGVAVEPQEVAPLPDRVVRLGDVLLGYGVARPARVSVSTDAGTSWTRLDDPVFSAGLLGGEVVFITPDGRLWRLDDPVGFDGVPVETRRPLVTSEGALGAVPVSWGQGIVVGDAAVLTMGGDGVATVEELPVGPESGLLGDFGRLVPGPGRWAIVRELGVPVLYRWTGD